MNQTDVIIIWICFAIALLFWALGVSKLLKTYLWILFWFLFCILLLLKIEFVAGSWWAKNVIDLALLNNRWFFTNLAVFSVPIFWLFFLLNNSINIKSKIWWIWEIIISLFAWFFLPFFLLWLYSMLEGLWITTSAFLWKILDFLSRSSFWEIFSSYEYIIFLLLFWLLFYKIVFYFFYYIIFFMLNKLHDLREEERENRRHGNVAEEEKEENNSHNKEH